MFGGLEGIASRARRGMGALAIGAASLLGAPALAQEPAPETLRPIEAHSLGSGEASRGVSAYKAKAIALRASGEDTLEQFDNLAYPTSPGALEYFGFTGACPDAATLRATKPFMNLCTIGVEDTRWSDRKWVAEMMKSDMRAILMLHNVFFRATGQPGQGPFDLWPDYAQRWQAAIAGKESNIAAITRWAYPADEPNWNGIDRVELKTAHDTIKESFPFIPTLTSLNHLITAEWFQGQPLVTDAAAYHRYGVDEPHSDPDFLSDIALIKSHAQDKEFVYVMDAWIPHGTGTIEEWETRMITRANNYYAVAAADPSARAVVGFHWPSWVEGIGASGMTPTARQMYRKIGSDITGKCEAPQSADGVLLDADKALFFQGCRFFATLDYSNGGPVAGRAYARPESDEFGQFTFFSDTNVELGLKIFHFPEPLGYYGVYISGYTNLDLDLRIYDSASGEEVYGGYQYVGGTLNPPGEIGSID